MKLEKCANGHFYDADKFTSCPHCGGAANLNETVSFDHPSKDVKTETLGHVPARNQNASAPEVKKPQIQDDQKTVGYFNFKDKEEQLVEPVVAWLVCTKGKNFGKDYRLKSGRNFIGRANEMDVCLANESSVSREKHAIVVYEPMNGLFLVQPGDSKELFYLNGDVVLSTMQLAKNDMLQVGETELRFTPFCDSEFKWEKN